ncbi:MULTISPECIES: hypothetical protein [Kitasatospora]|uniref:Uncharacterized protein n=1 Tax=Kitasatospora setae (strain ATCC 33774 / DSM 43861 / JCM 3304 / KCC A-0304 / NBRC 14216 / KM-6054) TaxID=452652 RepID=E4N6J9_KITSK|nr:hypothetical protein [Kitasatospora setae]BAJ26830.1 hypothetical protein KSE_09940 [Kitasatospora setae KM-6054]
MDQDDTPAARARWIGDALHKLTGSPPLVEQVPGGGYRVTVRVVEPPDPAVAAAVLRVLGTADRFGHRDRRQRERLWAEVGPPPPPPLPSS